MPQLELDGNGDGDGAWVGERGCGGDPQDGNCIFWKVHKTNKPKCLIRLYLSGHSIYVQLAFP